MTREQIDNLNRITRRLEEIMEELKLRESNILADHYINKAKNFKGGYDGRI